MAYVHCHSCGWGQDDFWDKNGYTPFRTDLIDFLRDKIFEDRVHIDAVFLSDCQLTPDGEDENGCWIRGTKFVASELRRKSESIEEMHWRTDAEWRQDPDRKKCPKCGERICID